MRSLKEVGLVGLVSVLAIAALCAIGCQPVCGDGYCEPEEEGRCASDCAACGDGICDRGEDCERDCGDDPVQPVCGNGLCEAGETATTCPYDCDTVTPPACDNDGLCESGETAANCPYDCEVDPPDPYCGDYNCDWGEDTFNCYDDCGWCGDGWCVWPQEDVWGCDWDCIGYCGDGYCEYDQGEEGWCYDDCGCPPDYPVDCGDGTGCWTAGTNCSSDAFVCGGVYKRCSNPADYANCCNGGFYVCPTTHPFYCAGDGMCYIGSAFPDPDYCGNCETFGWPCS